MDCRPRLTSSIYPWFRIRVYLLLDGLPTKAIELHLPDTLSGVTTKSNIDGAKTRSIIHFSYNGLASGFNDLDIDIQLKSKTDPQTTIYVVVYGVKGNVNNVSVSLWDRLYYYDNDSIEYEVPINVKGKDMIDVNKITTKYLDVNNNIDMKNRQIKMLKMEMKMLMQTIK